MTTITPQEEDLFDSILTSARNAMSVLNARKKEARAAGDLALEKELRKALIKLTLEAIKIRDAEIAYLNSTLPREDARKKLKEQTAKARKIAGSMADAKEALEAATKFVSLLTRFVKLF